jgi:hypothetical protein
MNCSKGRAGIFDGGKAQSKVKRKSGNWKRLAKTAKGFNVHLRLPCLTGWTIANNDNSSLTNVQNQHLWRTSA